MTDSETHEPESTAPRCCQTSDQLVSLDADTSGGIDKLSHLGLRISGTIKTAAGWIPVVSTELRLADMVGSWKARWAIRRMDYTVEPRLYAAGHPTENSPVFVTANYKMSFDRLRSKLGGIDCWILVLDTRGINVWCAAGKGTFGTDEVVRRVEQVGLRHIIEHRRLILPQLGAPGVSAHAVKERCGFRVVYGPVRARDIPAFLNAGMKATPEMRRVTFTFRERAVLIPADLVGVMRYALIGAACLLLLSGFGPNIFSLERISAYGTVAAVLTLSAAVIGVALPPSLLPWLPGRAFAAKGAWLGTLPALGILWLAGQHPEMFRNWLTEAAWFCLFPAISSFIAMNFTGSSTYTSLSGVRKEMRVAVPLQLAGAIAGLGLWITGLFI